VALDQPSTEMVQAPLPSQSSTVSDITDHFRHLMGVAQRCRSCAADLYAFAGSTRLIKKMLGLAAGFELEAETAAKIIGHSDDMELVWSAAKAKRQSPPKSEGSNLASRRARQAPVFRRAIRSNRDTDGKAVSVTFLGEDSNEHKITLAVQCVPITIGALLKEYGRVLCTLPLGSRPTAQALQGTGIVPAIGSNGSPALILQLKGGGELIIEFSKAAMAEASTRFTEILIAMREGRFH
jgi:hypothetical protein